jgi:hypothetical protein
MFAVYLIMLYGDVQAMGLLVAKLLAVESWDVKLLIVVSLVVEFSVVELLVVSVLIVESPVVESPVADVLIVELPAEELPAEELPVLEFSGVKMWFVWVILPLYIAWHRRLRVAPQQICPSGLMRLLHKEA